MHCSNNGQSKVCAHGGHFRTRVYSWLPHVRLQGTIGSIRFFSRATLSCRDASCVHPIHVSPENAEHALCRFDQYLQQLEEDCLAYADALGRVVAYLRPFLPGGRWVLAEHTFEDNDALFDVYAKLQGGESDYGVQGAGCGTTCTEASHTLTLISPHCKTWVLGTGLG